MFSTKELLQTPSELRDTVSQSWTLGKFQWNSLVMRQWNLIRISLVVNFVTLYLRAQMEFEGVLWC